MSRGDQSVKCESDYLALEGESALVLKKDMLKKLFGKNAEWKYFRRVSVSERRWGFIYLHAEMIASVKSSSNDEVTLGWRCFFGSIVPSALIWSLLAEAAVIQGEVTQGEGQQCNPGQRVPWFTRHRYLRNVGDGMSQDIPATWLVLGLRVETVEARY